MSTSTQAGAGAAASTRPWHWQPLSSQPDNTLAGYLVGDPVSDGRYSRPGERLHDLFEQYCDQLGVEQATKRVSVEYADASYSLLDLEHLANRIAHYLRGNGVKAGDRVALLFDRSVYAHASVLAISKLDASYVPLDASFPADRIAYICEDAGVSTALTLGRFDSLFAQADVNRLALDVVQDELDRMPVHRLPPDPDPDTPGATDSTAYIIYTSGSTGRPKGVSVWQSNICAFLRVATASYGYLASDRVYQGMTMAFDYSIEELWVPLLSGATLVPAPGEVNLIGPDLAQFIESRDITAMCCVPTLLATIDRDLPKLRFLMVSGEACPQDLADRWAGPTRRFLNTYGPTEATVTATWSLMEPGNKVCIGGPLPGYSIVILSPDSGEVLQRGEVGEIGIAGVGVAQGYVNLPEQTARAFVPDTVGLPDNPSGKIYRTGDLGLINENLQIEYQGRIDQQVKIRGYRIELDEIAGVARGVPGIGQVAVDAYRPPSGGVELVAYYTRSDAGTLVDPADLHREMKSALPPFMVPAYIEPVESIPMLPSGKVDRKRLPAPSGQRIMQSDKEYVAPQTSMQRELADQLAALLDVERVSVDADFFEDLGANSLIMARYLAGVRNKLGVRNVSIRMIYQHPSIAALADALDCPAQVLGQVAGNLGAGFADVPAGEAGAASNGYGQDAKPSPAGPARDVFYTAPRAAHIACGVAQVAYVFVMGVFATWLLIEMFRWVIGAATPTGIVVRGALAGWGTFVITCATLIGIKWLAVGRFRAQRIPLWSFAYFRFWVARGAIAANPMNLFRGAPIFNVYLRLLGAKVGRRSLFLAETPICTDLIRIGCDTTVRQDVFMSGYTARDGYLYCGPIDIGDRVLVAEASAIEPDTVIHNDGVLGTSSALHQGMQVPTGQTWQGSPAEPSRTRFNRIKTLSLPGRRAVLYSAAQVGLLLLSLPVPYVLLGYAAHGNILEAVAPVGQSLGVGDSSSILWVAGWVALITVAGYLASLVIGHISIFTLPRVINRFIKSGETHGLYGVQYALARLLIRTSHNQHLSRIYGDSSLITHFLSLVGYDLKESTQTGSNFGQRQLHHSPFLVKFRRNTLVSDGLVMLNMEVNSTSFRLSPIEFGEDNYLGNLVHWPAGAKVGANCLIGTKAMVPIDGEVRSGVGILGSPPFEIPRSVVSDKQFEHYKDPSQLPRNLAMKLRSNLVTIALYMTRIWSQIFLLALGLLLLLPTLADLLPGSSLLPAAILSGYALLVAMFFPAYIIAFERLHQFFHPMKPLYCSLYDARFWEHERYWKISCNDWVMAFVGTPLKPIYTRLQGARVGKQVFDDGANFAEPALVELGDFTCLNNHASVQSHSLEDGTFKSDHISIGSRCSLAVRGFVHYGTEVKDNALIRADAFVMKGSIVEAGDTWSGNPAHEVRDDEPVMRTRETPPVQVVDAPLGKAA